MPEITTHASRSRPTSRRLTLPITAIGLGLITTLAIAIACSFCSQHKNLSWHRRTEFGAIATGAGVLSTSRELFPGACNLNLSISRPPEIYVHPSRHNYDPSNDPNPSRSAGNTADDIVQHRDSLLAGQLSPTAAPPIASRQIPDEDIPGVFEEHKYRASCTHLAGWPLPCLSTLAIETQSGEPIVFDGMLLRTVRTRWSSVPGIVIPTTPLWPGLLVNITTWSIAWLLCLLAITTLRRKLRTRRGLCPRCAYDRLGDYSTPCPECGHTRAAT